VKLIPELRRRNVFRMAVLYVLAAWVVMQVAGVLMDLGVLTAALGPWVMWVLVIGFPIALVFSWLFEITPEGLAREKDVPEGAPVTHITGRRMDFIVIAVLSAGLILFAYDKWWTGPPPERSVAVLPFVNMSADQESTYFATGVADTILNMLAQVPGLHVAARTSSFQPRLNGMGAGEICDLLGVSAVLEGSVQRQGNRLRITAQLINADDESYLWSRNFDRDYGDVFAIQDEIAQAVTSALQLSLLGDTKQRIDREDTDNLEAFETFSRAMANLESPTTDSVQRAVAQLQHAIELDPDFARAHVMLGRAYHDPRYWAWSELSEEEIAARVRQQANTALQIAPGMSTALTLLAGMTYDTDAKRQLYLEALDNDPNNTYVLRRYANHLYYQENQFDEAIALGEKIIRLDPLDESNYSSLGRKQAFLSRPRACLDTTSRGLGKVPESVVIRDQAALCYFLLGDYRSAIALKYETLQIDSQDFWNRSHIGLLYLMSGMPDEAAHWLDSAAAASPPDDDIRRVKPLLLDVYYQRNDEAVFAELRQRVLDSNEIDPYYFNPARTLFVEYGAMLGRLDEVVATFEEVYPHLFADPPSNLNSDYGSDWNELFATGLALLRSGDVVRGDRLMRSAMEKRDTWDGMLFVYLYGVAGRLALGETDAALEKLRAFSKNKWYIGLGELIVLRHSRLYDPIRNEPEFIALLEAYDQNQTEQRRLLQAMDLPIN